MGAKVRRVLRLAVSFLLLLAALIGLVLPVPLMSLFFFLTALSVLGKDVPAARKLLARISEWRSRKTKAVIAFFFLLFTQEASGEENHINLRAHRFSLNEQNSLVDSYGLERIKNDGRLRALIKKEKLVRIPDSHSGFYLIPDMNERYRYARSWVLEFLVDFSEAVSQRLRVTSLVRTKSAQQNLVARGRSVADCSRGYSRCSTHTTGAAVDISFLRLGEEKRKKMREVLHCLMRMKKVHAIEEVWGNHYHVLVLPSFSRGSASTCNSLSYGGDFNLS